MIPQQFIDDLLRRVDVVEVVGQYVPLKRAGANYSGLCPFHTEKSPSFTVSPSKQFYHCFGCGAHGTALGFLIDHLGLPFPQAIEDLARRVGLEVPREAAREDPEKRKLALDQRARLKDRLLEAAKFYQRRLKDSPHAVDYLKGRGLSGEIAARYHLGYSPQGWQPLQAVFADYDSKDLVDAGLVIEGESDKRYDRFRDRIMFPILSSRGEVLGFGARTLGADEPKYLNSPETPVFSKGEELYGVFEARQSIRESNQVWVVEGYMDVVALAQHGIGHAVATLGTATTPSHIKSLLRLSDHVVFMFDGDAAGQRAAARALDTALAFASEKSKIHFAFLPVEHDPDSYVRAFGSDALKELVQRAQPLSAWLIDVCMQDQNIEIAEGRAAALSELVRRLKTMPENALRAQIARDAARRFDVAESSISTQLLSSLKQEARSGAPEREVRAKNFSGRQINPPTIRPLGERFLQIIIRKPQWCLQVPQEAQEALDETQLALLNWIKSRCDSSAAATFATLHEAALAEGRERGSDAVRLFIRLARPDAALDELLDSDPTEFEAEFFRSVNRLRLRILEEKASALAARAESEPAVLQELSRIRSEITGLKR